MSTMQLKNIKKVVILDDDWECLFSLDALRVSGIDQQVLDRLEDNRDRETKEYLKVLAAHSVSSETIDDRVKAMGMAELYSEIPQYYKTNLVDIHHGNFSQKKQKLDEIYNILIGLGVPDEHIFKYASVEAFQDQGEALYINDLFLKEGNRDLSINLIKQKVGSLSADDKSQFIVMSYDHVSLLSLFENLRPELKVSTARFKIIDKPDGSETSQLLWKNGILQLDREYDLIGAQENLLKCLDANIEVSLAELRKSLWSLDASSFYRFYLTADADHSTLGEYFSELMMWHILGVFEGNHVARDNLKLLQDGLVQYGPFMGPSIEANKLAGIANAFLADLVSYRPGWLAPIMEDNGLKKFISDLKFGGIYIENATGKLFVHLTRPCDYVHAKPETISNDYLLFLTGNEIRSFDSLPKENVPIVVTPYVNVNGRIKYFEWYLKRPFTTTIESMFQDFRQKFTLLGQLRHSFAIGLVNKYASSMSEVAHLRLPYAEDIAAHHLYYSPESACFLIHTGSEEIKYEKVESFVNCDLRINLYFVHDKKSVNVVFPYLSSSIFSYQYKTAAEKTDAERMAFSAELMKGITKKRGGVEYFTLLDNKSLTLCPINHFVDNHTELLAEAQKIYQNGKVIFNCLVYDNL